MTHPAARFRPPAHPVRFGEGVRGLWFRALGRAGYRRLEIWVRPIELPEVAPLPPGCAVVEVGGSDLERYLRFRPDHDAAAVRQRWNRGDRCHAVVCAGQFVHLAWSASDVAVVDFLRLRAQLPAGVVYLYDAATAPDQRQLGLALARAHHVTRIYGAAGYRWCTAATLPENTAARAFQHRLGARPVATLRRWPWEFGWIERPWPT